MMGKAYLEDSEVERLEAAATNLRDRLLIRLLFRTGCRVSEIVGLEVGDVDIRAGTVRVLRLKQRLQVSCPRCGARLGRSHHFCPACGEEVAQAVRTALEVRRMRTLPLDPETVRMLSEFIAGDGPLIKNGGHLLFGIGRGQAWRVVSGSARRAGLGALTHPESGKEHGVSPHRLRDAFAVHAMKADDSGDGLRLLQEQLGHVSFNTTARYRKVAGEEHRRWYERLWTGSPAADAPTGDHG